MTIYEQLEKHLENSGTKMFVSQQYDRNRKHDSYSKNSPYDRRPKFAVTYPKTSSGDDNERTNAFNILMDFSTIAEIKFGKKMIYVIFENVELEYS